MRPLERKLRRAINPISTGLTAWWCGIGPRRQVPVRRQQRIPEAGPSDRPRAFFGVPSPGDWIVPAGQRPGWQWLPEHGATPNLPAMPRWVRLWYRTPLLDRYVVARWVVRSRTWRATPSAARRRRTRTT